MNGIEDLQIALVGSDTVITAGTAGTITLVGFTSVLTDMDLLFVTPQVSSRVIEAHGSTQLDQVGSALLPETTARGRVPRSRWDGVEVVAGQVGGWTPISAEKTESGYEVAWKVAGADQYTVWNTDASGNFTGYALSGVVASGSDSAVAAAGAKLCPRPERQRTDRHPAGRHRGVRGDAAGSGRPTHFFLDDSTGSGPSLKVAGVDFVAGQYGDWAPISAEKTAGGYEVAWKNGAVDQYGVWTTDANGTYTGHALPGTSGSDPLLQQFEPSFAHDLNGNGQIGDHLAFGPDAGINWDVLVPGPGGSLIPTYGEFGGPGYTGRQVLPANSQSPPEAYQVPPIDPLDTFSNSTMWPTTLA